ncbi:MAG: hypothetical protein PHS37_09720 [Candidatus Omnitrophica bacterium]|nr:hypothetical protein [Candidatus Omnitrophota bacterium]
MKKLFTVLIVLIAVCVLVGVVKDVAIKGAVENAVGIVTGLKLHIQSFKVGVVKPLVAITNLRLFNPDTFRDRIMLDMPEIYVDYNLRDIMRGTIHLNEVRIDIKELDVIKNEKGELNLDSLNVVREQKTGEKPAGRGEAPKIQIDKLTLKIGKAVYKDYSKGDTPFIQEFNLNLNETYVNVGDPNALVGLIITKTLMRTSIGNLANIDIRGLDRVVSGKLTEAANAALATVGNTQETLNATTGTLKDTAKQLGQALNVFGGDKNKQ